MTDVKSEGAKMRKHTASLIKWDSLVDRRLSLSKYALYLGHKPIIQILGLLYHSSSAAEKQLRAYNLSLLIGYNWICI